MQIFMKQYSNQTSKILYVIFKFMKKICVKKWKLVFLRHNTFIHLCLQLLDVSLPKVWTFFREIKMGL